VSAWGPTAQANPAAHDSPGLAALQTPQTSSFIGTRSLIDRAAVLRRQLLEQGRAGAEPDLLAGEVLGARGELEPAGQPQLRGEQLGVAGAGPRVEAA
jgi:hypothetical protein